MNMKSIDTSECGGVRSKIATEAWNKCFLSPREFCKKTGISYSKFLRLAGDAQIPVTRIGRRLLVPSSFLGNLEQQAYQSVKEGADAFPQ